MTKNIDLNHSHPILVERSDFPVIKAVTVYVAIATMIFNLIGDVLYRLTDPRVQLR